MKTSAASFYPIHTPPLPPTGDYPGLIGWLGLLISEKHCNPGDLPHP